MTSTIPSAALVPAAYELDLRQFASSCQQHQLRLFQARRADIECFRATSKPAATPGPPSRGGSAPSLGSTGTPLRKNSSAIPRPRTSAGPAWTSSRTPPGWTVTSSARCRSPPGLDRLRSAH